MNEIKQSPKPPLGLIPEHLWKMQRMTDLEAAIDRYVEHGMEVPRQWCEEYWRLFDEVF